MSMGLCMCVVCGLAMLLFYGTRTLYGFFIVHCMMFVVYFNINYIIILNVVVFWSSQY